MNSETLVGADLTAEIVHDIFEGIFVDAKLKTDNINPEDSECVLDFDGQKVIIQIKKESLGYVRMYSSWRVDPNVSETTVLNAVNDRNGYSFHRVELHTWEDGTRSIFFDYLWIYPQVVDKRTFVTMIKEFARHVWRAVRSEEIQAVLK